MPSERVLVCGAGVAGSILAFWLAKYDFEVVVIERSRAEQKAGQGIEIEEPALSVVREMGILPRLNEVKTGEAGCEVVDEKSRSYGILGAGNGPTGELELMRGDLTEVLYKAADAHTNVTYHFETTIHSLRQTEDKVFADLQDRSTKSIRTEEFDLVVGADGARSRTRELVMGPNETLNCLKPIGAFVAYFSIPAQPHDWPYSRICNFTDRRLIWVRPVAKDSKTTSVYLIHVKDSVPALRQANTAGDRTKQKEAFAELYSGLGWESQRVIEQMMKAENFYSDEPMQVKLKKWSQGRVALLGDAAWAPTPFTGEGNQMAIIGAFVLAQEMSRSRTPVAYEMYHKRFRKYVEEGQQLPLYGYAPYLFVPRTSLGIWLFQMAYYLLTLVLRFLSWTKLSKFFLESSERAERPFDLEIEQCPGKKHQ